VLVFAKTTEAQRALRRQFELHEPEREYIAIVAGQIEAGHGTFRSLLATGKNLTRYSTNDRSRGELAITHFTVERRMADATLVRIRLETGRRNQIRVHFAEAGHPVLGDPRYEHHRARHAHWDSPRLALHASVLSFTHPTTGQPCRFFVPPPAEFRRFLAGFAN
jgi:23S rRNA pseudouridine1911/1915/1917 synthase